MRKAMARSGPAALFLLIVLVCALPAAATDWPNSHSLGRLGSSGLSQRDQCTPPGCALGRFPGAGWVPYAPTSPFNLRLQSAALAIDPTSGAIVHDLVSGGLLYPGGHSVASWAGNFVISKGGYSGWPTFYSSASDPSVTVTCGVPGSDGDCPSPGFSVTMHMPASASSNPANVPDQHMTVVDQAAAGGPVEYDLYQVQPRSSATQMMVGGLGYERVDVSDGVSESRPGGRATAAGFGNLAGRIRGEEFASAVAADAAGNLAQAELPHVLSIAVACDNGTVTPPALPTPGSTHSSGLTCTGGHAPPMGGRLVLNVTEAQIDAAAPYPWQRVLLRTMRDYGVIVNDTGSGGGFMTLQAEGGWQYRVESAPDPWWTLLTSTNDTCAGNAPAESPLTGWEPYVPPPGSGVVSGDPECVGHFDNNDEFHRPGVDPAIWNNLQLVAYAFASATPSSGQSSGGTTVTLHGSGLRSNASVAFGGAAANVVGAASDGSSLVVQTPSHAPGSVDVVLSEDGQSATLRGAYTFTGSPLAFTAASPPLTATERVTYSYTFAASGDPVPTFALATGAPRWLSIDPRSGSVSGIPPAGSGGSAITYSVVASNTTGSVSAGPFTVRIAAGQTRPTFTAASPPRRAWVRLPYRYRFRASGRPAATFSLSGAPSWLHISRLSGLVSGTPPVRLVGKRFRYTVRASNSAGSATAGPFTISVTRRRATPAAGDELRSTASLDWPSWTQNVLASAWPSF
jgi:IPT/TIG domain/Putative Ig domain